MFKKSNRREDERRRIADRLTDIRRTQDACFDDLLQQNIPCPPQPLSRLETGEYPVPPAPEQPPPSLPHAWTRKPRPKGNAKTK